MIREDRAAVAATQIIATGMKIAISIIRNRREPAPVASASGGSITKKMIAPRSQTPERTIAAISIPVIVSALGLS